MLCRYLAVRARLPLNRFGLPMVARVSPDEQTPLQPTSLMQHPRYLTPVSRRTMIMAGRGRSSTEGSTAWQSKVGTSCMGLAVVFNPR